MNSYDEPAQVFVIQLQILAERLELRPAEPLCFLQVGDGVFFNPPPTQILDPPRA